MSHSIVIPSASTHKGYILYTLLRGKHVRNKDFFYAIDTCASGCRISELRSDMWEIDDKFIHMTTKENKEVRVKEYFIKATKILEYKQIDSVVKFLDVCDQIYAKSA